MSEGLFNVLGGGADRVAMVYLIVGLAVFGAAFLPGNSPLYKVVSLIVGGAISVAAAKFLMFGGMVYVSLFAFLAPFALLVIGAIGALRSVLRRPVRPAMRPHPAARQFGQSYQPHLPGAYPAYSTDPWAGQYAPRPDLEARAHAPADRPGAHAAQPTGHIPRQPGPRQVEVVNPYAGRARHRAS
ncbi:hypothetical protein [Dactylosporangium sp. NPDC051541]|uniref:hypothetical protein n=1 Tax=Dactylosporangium sp. NPDC051541 TaxID=3363977 RepID=UPI0037B4105A